MAGFYKPPWWLRRHGYKRENDVLFEVFKVRWYAWPFVVLMLILGNAKAKGRNMSDRDVGE